MFDRAYHGWSLKHVVQNDLFISLSFYRNIVYKMSRVNKALFEDRPIQL